MKILALRGKNLASLGGEFVVDFTQEPLAGAGLYAITGATGSGKSTLLDALCLALYERTPRLQKASTKGETIPDVGDNAVSAADPRTILRRGASEGFAEVDFTGSDDVAYRARWSVRRARAKADGKLQASDMVLTRLADGERLGDHTKTETLRLIEGFVGLSFEQFTRAVLLAQNDFATFLKAPDDERAELLQTLTGTETFSTISRQAFSRMKLEGEALLRLQDQLRLQQPLAPAARADLDTALHLQAARLEQLQAHQDTLEDQLRWHQQQAKLQQDLADASALAAAAVDALDAAAPRQAALHRLEQVQGARRWWMEQERLTQALGTGTQAVEAARTQQKQAQQQLQDGQSALALVQVQMAGAQTAWTYQQPAIARARELDASTTALMPELQAAEQARDEAQSQLEAQQLQHAQTTEQITASQSELDRLDAWLQGHADLRLLAQAWPRWDTLLSNAQALRNSQRLAEAEAARLATEAASLSEHRAQAQATLEQALATADAARAELDAWAQACAAVDAEALARTKKALEQQRDGLQTAALLWQQRSDVRGQRLRLQEQQLQHNAALMQADRELQECAQQQPSLAAAQRSADQAVQLARAAASQTAQALRQQLQADQPCPVCGAAEHPYADHSAALDAVLLGLQQHLEQAQQAMLALRERSAAASANKAAAARALEHAAAELLQLAAQREVLLQAWSHLALHEALEAVAQTERSAWLQQHQEQVRDQLAQLGLQEAAQRQNVANRDAAQRAFDAANRSRETAGEALVQWSRRGDHISQSQISLQRQTQEQAQQLDATLDQLDSAFADAQWRPVWDAAPTDFVLQCRSDAEAWNTQQQSHGRVTQALVALQVQCSAGNAACTRAAQQLATHSARYHALDTQLQNYRMARAGLLQGQDVAAVEAGLHADAARARAGLATAQTQLDAATSHATRLQESVRLLLQQQEQLLVEEGNAQAALDQWLHDFNATAIGQADTQALSTDGLQTLLATPVGWIASERQALHALQSAVASSHAVRETRQQSLAQHEAVRAMTEGVEALQEQLQQVQAELAVLSATWSERKLDQARDNERLAASAALRLHIERQEVVAGVWSRLSELIGSADGKKFRNFAQQLTLDILLGYGNSHLQTLSRRYRIQRIQDSLGLLVVDQDMGDEVRSVHSLSGGESFLVSLALALGLASLSSHRVRVESLFIDEGFGSLDADSLRVAMDALDSLQSLGRKVGVISHVQEMTERIGTRVEVQRQAGGLSRIVVS
jgi:exonuclease SbcC